MQIWYPGQKERKDGGFTINDHWNSQTGQLGPHTLLHNRYHIQRVIGQGGMGAVYQAKDVRRRSAICAIKEMSLSMVPPEERAQAVRNFKTEAKMLWGLSHPNLPAVTNFFSENQRHFLVMEYIDGYTLEDLLARNNGPFPERRVLAWAEELCNVLKYLHSQNPPIIFRDMKPGNIMLTRQGHIKLIDFGIARFFRPAHAGMPDTQLLGTPGYAPPEQYGMGHSQTDERSDIYSLGMTLYHLLTNTLADEPVRVRARDIQSINPRVSDTVAQALAKATMLEADERYQSVDAFWNALSGAGRFVFESGEVATVPQELAELSAQYPDEAAEYLAAGEITAWLQDIGETDLVRAVSRIRVSDDDPMAAVEQFLRIIAGPKARPRALALHEMVADIRERQPAILGDTGSFRSASRLLPSRRTAPLLVSPRTLDFGTVYPGLSTPLTITINGDQGLYVRGTLHATEPWIKLERTRFDGMSTHINVRVNSMQLNRYTHYTGSVIISPELSDGQEAQEIVVIVEADVQGYSPLAGRRRPGKTNVPDLDEEEEEEFTTSGTMQAISQASKPAPLSAQQADLDYKYKTIPTEDGTAAYWEPNPLTVERQQQQRRYMTLATAFMAGGLVYTILANLLKHILPPNPWFLAILTALAPATTLGALLISRDAAWYARETKNRLCTGITAAFVALTLVNLLWNIFLADHLGLAQVFFLLLTATLAGVWGSQANVSATIVRRVIAILRKPAYRRFLMFGILMAGGVLGGFLRAGLAQGFFFTLSAILIGIGAALVLIWYLDTLLKSARRP